MTVTVVREEAKKFCDLEAALETAFLLQTYHEPRWVLRRKVEDQKAIDRASVEMLRREATR